MSVSIINQVYDETRRLAIAGSNLASGDFRLKKLVPALEKAAAKAPVFAKVSQSIERLISASEKDAPQALLDLSSLLNAILYTQGQTGATGKLKAIESTEMEIQSTQTSARVVKPLIEALTTTGSGRQNLITEAFENGAFNDLRLVNYAIDALDDKFGEIADYVADKVLPTYGKAIVPRIVDRIDIKGRAGNVRRLRLLYRLEPEMARPFVLEAFENGSKEMRIAALACLGDSEDDLPHLHEQSKSKSKDVRAIAYERMARFSDDQTVDLLNKALGTRDLNLVISPISQTKSPRLLDVALQFAKKCYASLPDLPAKKFNTELEKLSLLLGCFLMRNEKPVLSFIGQLFDERDGLKGKATNPIFQHYERTIVETVFESADKKLQQNVVAEFDSLNDATFDIALTLSACVLKPQEFYDKFSPIYVAEVSKRKTKQAGKREMISSFISNRRSYRYHYYRHGAGWWRHEQRNPLMQKAIEKLKLDARWLDSAMAIDDLDAVYGLCDPKHKSLHKYIESRLASENKKTSSYDLARILELAIMANHPKATDFLIETVERQASKKHYYLYWVFSLFSKLPKNSVPKIEALLPKLPERIVDEILPHLQTLKAK